MTRVRGQWSLGAAGPMLMREERAERRERKADDWQDRALCAETDPEAFFPEKGGSTREAKAVCRNCDVRAQCLEYALEHDERFGIWGGLSERERRRLKRQAAIPVRDAAGHIRGWTRPEAADGPAGEKRHGEAQQRNAA